VEIKSASKLRSIKVTEPLKEEILTLIRSGKTTLIEKKSQYISKFGIKSSIGDVQVTYDKLKKQIVSVTEHQNEPNNDDVENIPVKMTKLLKQFSKK
jgi:hypothetical protein